MAESFMMDSTNKLRRTIWVLPSKLFLLQRKCIYKLFGKFIQAPSIEHLQEIRELELQEALKLLPPAGKLLEIGAGAGWQAIRLADKGYKVIAVDVPPESSSSMESIYRENRIFPVLDYDGCHLPFPDDEFDIVFSSSVLEHVHDGEKMQNEILRILKNDGFALHIMPSAIWRFYSALTHFIRLLSSSPYIYLNMPNRHGEKGNILTEHYYFSRYAWSKFFKQNGWNVLVCKPNSLFYTGESIFDASLSLKARKILSIFLGSSCNMFLVTKRRNMVVNDKG